VAPVQNFGIRTSREAARSFEITRTRARDVTTITGNNLQELNRSRPHESCCARNDGSLNARIALKVLSLHRASDRRDIRRYCAATRSEPAIPGRGEREETRANTNSSRPADIKFAFILCSVIYDTDLSRAVDVRTPVIVFPRVCTRAASLGQLGRIKRKRDTSVRELRRELAEANEANEGKREKEDIRAARGTALATHCEATIMHRSLRATCNARVRTP